MAGASVAQVVERGTENPCVGGSTPPGGTIYFISLPLNKLQSPLEYPPFPDKTSNPVKLKNSPEKSPPAKREVGDGRCIIPTKAFFLLGEGNGKLFMV